MKTVAITTTRWRSISPSERAAIASQIDAADIRMAQTWEQIRKLYAMSRELSRERRRLVRLRHGKKRSPYVITVQFDGSNDPKVVYPDGFLCTPEYQARLVAKAWKEFQLRARASNPLPPISA